MIVPFYAKSAASLIALSASDLIVLKAGELGPVDPQVLHPAIKGLFFPASSIKDARDFVESTQDETLKITMADKLDPYLIGAYNSATRQSRQYLEEIPKIKNSKKKRISSMHLLKNI